MRHKRNGRPFKATETILQIYQRWIVSPPIPLTFIDSRTRRSKASQRKPLPLTGVDSTWNKSAWSGGRWWRYSINRYINIILLRGLCPTNPCVHPVHACVAYSSVTSSNFSFLFHDFSQMAMRVKEVFGGSGTMAHRFRGFTGVVFVSRDDTFK